jgi:hypothetical protein
VEPEPIFIWNSGALQAKGHGRFLLPASKLHHVQPKPIERLGLDAQSIFQEGEVGPEFCYCVYVFLQALGATFNTWTSFSFIVEVARQKDLA